MNPTDIVIKVWNAVDHVSRTVESVSRCTHESYRIVVVDDGSRPSELDRLRMLPGVTLIEHGSNLGAAAAARTGYENTGSELVVLMDSDVLVSDGWLGRLARHMRDPEVALVSPLRYSRFKYPGSQKSTRAVWDEVRSRITDPAAALEAYLGGRSLERFRLELVAHNGLADLRVVAPPGFVSSSCVLLRRSLVDAAGGIAGSEFRSYGEDVDLCWRLGSKGYKVIRSAAVYVHHFEHASVEASNCDRLALMEYGNRVLYEKWGPIVLELGAKYSDEDAKVAFPFVALFRDFAAKGSGSPF